MRDQFGRPVNSLRISVTRACNLRCFYCHKEGQIDGDSLMGIDEIGRLIKVAVSTGIKRIKITGGEPLTRPDIIDLVARISPHVQEVSMTTNGVLLADMAKDLKAAGLKRVNISLHSLHSDTYSKLVGLDRLDDVKKGIRVAIEAGLEPVKLNMVYLRGLNEHELPEMISFASKLGVTLQVIEYEVSKEKMKERSYKEHHGDLESMEVALKASAEHIGVNPLHRRKKYRLTRLPQVEGWDTFELERPVDVEIVRPMHNSDFCKNCTRIRLTSSGHIKGCLFDDEGTIDALGPLRDGADDEQLMELYKKVIINRRPYWSENDVY